MNINRIRKQLRAALNPSARAVAVAAGLAAGGAQALTTTATFNLGAQNSGTSIPAQAVLSPAWIAAGTLPAGSILRSVSIDARLDTEGGGDTYANDLFVYIDPGAPPSGGEILQVGGYDAFGSPATRIAWATGGSGALGTTCVDTKNAPADFPDTIDLNGAGVFIGSRGAASASWSGTVTVEYDVFVPAAILSFGPGAVVGPLVGNAAAITWIVPTGTDVTALAPTFKLSSGTCDRDNGGPTTYDFTSPVVYTVTDGANVNTYTVTVTAATTVVWNVAGGGDWDLTTENWLGQTSGLPTTFGNGDEVLFDKTAGGTIAIAPDMSPLSTTVSAASGTYVFTGNPLASGSLSKSGGGRLELHVTPANFSSIAVSGGTLYLFAAESGFAPNAAPFTIPDVTVESGATLEGYRARATGGTLTLNGGRYFEYNGWNDGGWDGPVHLASNSYFGRNGACYNQTINGEISGPGGFTFSTPNNAVLTLNGTNTYAGPTIVTGGTLRCSNIAALGGGALRISPGGAKVNLNYTGERNIAALTLGGVVQASGTYGSTASDATHKNDTYFVGTGTVRVPASALNNMLTFSFGALGAATIGDTTITMEVPFGTDRTNLTPTYTVSLGATGSPASGTARNFTSAQTYTVTAEDLSTKEYTVTVTEAVLPDIFTWADAVSGNWSVPANWTNEEGTDTAPLAGGRKSYTLNFDAAGTYTATNNMNSGFELNQLNLGSAVTLAGNSLAFAENDAKLPTINQNSAAAVVIGNDLDLGADTTVDGTGSGQVNLAGVIPGTGSLTKSTPGVLKIYGLFPNTYSGGTVISSGTLWVGTMVEGISPLCTGVLGTGPVTLGSGATIAFDRVVADNALVSNGGTLYIQNGWGVTWSGPITLNANTTFNALFTLTCSNTISGTGGLLKTSGGPLILSGTNSYTGPTSVTGGTLRCDSTNALSGSSALSISGTGKVNLNYSGTKAIASLTLGGVAQTAPGTYGATASGADFQDDAYFTAGSTGTVTVGSGSDYDTWLGEFTFASGADTTPTGDPDGDGMTNQEEYAFGLNPTLGSSVSPIIQQLDPVTGNFQYTRRATPAATGLTYTVLTSTDLAAWAPGGATETGFTTAGNVETVTVNVTAPAVGGKLFVRVEAAPVPAVP